MRPAEALALGLLQGPAELLPMPKQASRLPRVLGPAELARLQPLLQEAV